MSETSIEPLKTSPVTQLGPPASTGQTQVQQTEPTLPKMLRLTKNVDGANALAAVIEIDKLYDAPAGSMSQMAKALELLVRTSSYLEEARRTDDAIEADRIVQRAQLLIPRLFACRTIGDGFGVIINAIYFAFINQRGKPLSAKQVGAVVRVLKELRVRPGMTLEQGIDRVEELDDVGLEVSPSVLGEILDQIEDE
jgi:hypothetical protein